MTPEPIHVSMAVNRGYEVPLRVALTSLAVAHEPGECAVTVLHGGLSPRSRHRIQRIVGDHFALDWILVDEGMLTGAQAPAHLTMACLYRLLLPRLLPERERTIYLDADLVVLESLQGLWGVELEGHTLAAVRDAASPWAAGPAGTDWRGVGIAPHSPYFNSGVLLLPLELWRREDLSKPALAILRRVKTPWGDQCALNGVAEGSWLELPRRWNLQTADATGRGLAWALWRDSVEAALANPAIIHYNDRPKPWTPGARHPLADRWFQFLATSNLASRQGRERVAAVRPGSRQ